MRTLAFLLLLTSCWASSAQGREARCGWLHNPTPGNWWLADRQGNWVLSTQGAAAQVDGMDLIPDISARDYVRTNGSYGYGCACLTGEFDPKDKRVRLIASVRQLPLARCREDKSLPRP